MAVCAILGKYALQALQIPPYGASHAQAHGNRSVMIPSSSSYNKKGEQNRKPLDPSTKLSQKTIRLGWPARLKAEELHCIGAVLEEHSMLSMLGNFAKSLSLTTEMHR